MNSPELTAPATGAPRVPLTRASIVVAAVAFVDEHGLAALTMRRLGVELGVEAMSLYHHIKGRDDLLEAMVAALVEDARVPTHAASPHGDSPHPDLSHPDSSHADSHRPDGRHEDREDRTDDWHGYVRRLAHSVRSLAVQHPQLFPLVATRPPAAPWLRPPLRSIGMVEDFLTTLLACGLDDAEAVHAYRAFASFLLGHLLLEVAVRGGSLTPEAGPLDEDADAAAAAPEGLDAHPTVRRLRSALSRSDPDAEFAAALEHLLDQLDHALGP